MRRQASSQASWALLTEGVTKARVEAHRLRHLINRAQELVEESSQKDHIYQVAGDIIQALPAKLDLIENSLDGTSYALAIMGKDFLRTHLSLSDRQFVEDAVASSFGGQETKESVERVARRHLASLVDLKGAQIDLGPLPKRQADLFNNEAQRVYRVEIEKKRGLFHTIRITPHAQYRMDLRSVTVEDIKAALMNFGKMLNDYKSQKDPLYDYYIDMFRRRQAIEYVEPKLGDLAVVFTATDREATIVTVFWKGLEDPESEFCGVSKLSGILPEQSFSQTFTKHVHPLDYEEHSERYESDYPGYGRKRVIPQPSYNGPGIGEGLVDRPRTLGVPGGEHPIPDITDSLITPKRRYADEMIRRYPVQSDPSQRYDRATHYEYDHVPPSEAEYFEDGTLVVPSNPGSRVQSPFAPHRTSRKCWR